ncbi:MAG TPA: hypothetical protein PKA90_02330 [Ignavibacteria bacterium]|nr:hypothetical protein [Ignavibacteria bacterium]HMR39245.1 hypothetical protein [Ignavibacteria bacterium]
MKTYLLLTYLLLSSISPAQIDDFLKKTVGNKDAWLPGKSITTSINDAYPTVGWLGMLSNSEPDTIDSWNNMTPGYHRILLQSYCLKAGTYGPTKGSGYRTAPLLGKNADIVYGIVERSADHPDIAQRDIQLLLWAIEAGTKFTDLPNDLQIRVKPLLTAEDMARLSVDVSDLTDLLPSDLVDLAKFYKELGSKITNPTLAYQDIERFAVQNAGVELDLKEEINDTRWAYIGNNFYIRAVPIAYYKTSVDVFYANPAKVDRDSKDRIVKIGEGEGSIDIVYDDEPGRDILSTSGNPDLPIWRFKTITLNGPDGESMVLENAGWMVRGDGKPISGSTGKGLSVETDNSINTPTYAEYNSRLKGLDAEKENIKKVYSALKKKKSSQGENSLSESQGGSFDADSHFKDGMKAATDPGNIKDKQKWIDKNTSKTMEWWQCAINALAGGSCDGEPEKPEKIKLPKFPSAPTEPSKQRILVSKRSFK